MFVRNSLVSYSVKMSSKEYLMILCGILLLVGSYAVPTSSLNVTKFRSEGSASRLTVAAPTGTTQKEPEPQFIGPIQNVTAAVGREAILECRVSNLGNYRVGWMRADDQTILSLHTRVVTHSARVSVSVSEPGAWRLHIRPLRETDRGCYMCQINTPTMKKQYGCIDVHVPPDILDEGTSGDAVAREGGAAALSCSAEGRPPPRITWRREDGAHIALRNQSGELQKVDVFVGQVLNLTRLERRQMGAYLCIASNDVPPSVSKRIVLVVSFPPSVLVANQLQGVPTGADAELECFVEAYPAIISYWMKNRGEMLLESSKHSVRAERVGAYQTRMILTIREFESGDIGTYTCVATNAMGTTDGTIRVYEIKMTTTTSTTTTTTTSTTTTTPLPPQTTTQLEIIDIHNNMVGFPPAEQKIYTPDVTTYDSMENVIEQSVVENAWSETTGAPSGRHDNYAASFSLRLRPNRHISAAISLALLALHATNTATNYHVKLRTR